MRLSYELHVACAGILLTGEIHRAIHEIVNLGRPVVFLLTSALNKLLMHTGFYDNTVMSEQAISELKLK